MTNTLKQPERVTVHRDANEQLLYFTSPSLTDDGNYLFFLSDRTGHPNIFRRTLTTGEENQISDNSDGFLKSYVYFDGLPERGLAKAGVCLDGRRGVIYYIQATQILRADPGCAPRVLAALPEKQVTAFIHVSADGKRLCVPVTDDEALGGRDILTGKPAWDIDARVRERGLSSRLIVYDTDTGRVISEERIPREWITHVQFSPADPSVILYNNEWTTENPGWRRMWISSGGTRRALRQPGENRSADDWVCHEVWERDGRAIVYHGGYKGGAGFLGRVTLDGSITEIAFPEGWHDYGHFTLGPDNWCVSDGYFRMPDEADKPARSGAWLSLQHIDWEKKSIRWIPLCRHGSSWKHQDAHPHPVFSPDGRFVYFTSDRDGNGAVYRVSVSDII